MSVYLETCRRQSMESRMLHVPCVSRWWILSFITDSRTNVEEMKTEAIVFEPKFICLFTGKIWYIYISAFLRLKHSLIKKNMVHSSGRPFWGTCWTGLSVSDAGEVLFYYLSGHHDTLFMAMAFKALHKEANPPGISKLLAQNQGTGVRRVSRSNRSVFMRVVRTLKSQKVSRISPT